MSENIENVDSENMKVLSEFRRKGETENNEIAFRLGVLGSDFIIATKSKRGEIKEANVIPTDDEINEEFDELYPYQYENEYERNSAQKEMREQMKKVLKIRYGAVGGAEIFYLKKVI